MLTILTALVSGLVSVPPALPPVGLTAMVTDPLSHGTLGDGLLSFDEAIRLANGTLTLAQLSAAEAANVTGTGTIVDHILIDPVVTLSIALQAPLTPVTGQGVPLSIEGIVYPQPPGFDDVMTLLVGGSHAWILALRTQLVTVTGLHFDTGQVGIDVHTVASGQVEGTMAMVEDCDLHGQTSAGIRLTGAGTDHSGVMLHHAHFHNMARGILIDDQSAGGWAMVHGEHCHMDLVALGIDVQEAGTGGDMSMCMVFRSEFAGGANFLRVRRTAGSDQQFMARITHCDVVATGDAVDVQGNTSGLTMVHHHHSDLTAGTGQKAMFCWPRTALFDFHGSEMVFHGDVSIAANLFSQRIWQQNNRYVGGTLTFDVDSSLPNLLWNHYENCAIVVPATAHTPVRIRSSELVNTTVNGQSLFAPVTLETCWRSGGSLSGQVAEVTPAPAAYLAEASVAPTEVPIGTSFTLTADTPANIGLAWFLTLAIDQPNTTQEPFRFYGDPLTAEFFFVGAGHTQDTLVVPNDPYFVGFEFYFTALSFPFGGQTYVPPFLLPRGGLMRPTF